MLSRISRSPLGLSSLGLSPLGRRAFGLTALSLATAGVAASTLGTAAPAFAQGVSPNGARPARVRGTVVKLDGNILTVTLRDGKSEEVTLQPEARVLWLSVAQPTDIQKGSYVGTAAVPNADGTLRALEVQVFPPSMRGVGEGHRPWDLGAQSSMTNGTVGSLTSAQGRTMTITYQGGEKKVVIPDNVPIVTYSPADRAALTAGAHIIANGMRAADGKVTAASVSVGKNGLVPPM